MSGWQVFQGGGREKKGINNLGINNLGKSDNFHLPHIMKVGGSLCSLCTSHPTSSGESFSP